MGSKDVTDALEQIAKRMGRTRVTRLPQIGIVNAVYLLDDDLILRVPREGPGEIASACYEPLPDLPDLSWAERPMSQLFELVRFSSLPASERRRFVSIVRKVEVAKFL